ncbi:MAG: hypothetical protein Q4E87_00895, partial [bacterium]|nr:hypothetical protein [bacterium]
AYHQMQLAIASEGAYVEHDDYVVTMRNESANYTVYVTVTDDASFADYMYDLERRVAEECAVDPINEGDTYVVTLARCNGYTYTMLTYQIIKQKG